MKSKKTAHQEVVEERVFENGSVVVNNLAAAAVREFIAHETPTAAVKDALQQVLDKKDKLKSANQDLADAKSALDILSADQARVRENLKIIPQTSEHYKDFLKKFVDQEARIDEARRQIRGQEAGLRRMTTEYQAFVDALTVR